LTYNQGDSNTAVGRLSLSGSADVGSGNGNSALGVAALARNSGDNNIGIGMSSGRNMIGDENVAIGNRAGQNITTANRNIAIGPYALGGFLNGIAPPSAGEAAIGHDNTAIGAEALRYNAAGTSNIAVGRAALQFNINGHFNTATGVGALENLERGEGNVALGTSAMGDLETDILAARNYNTAVGYQAGKTIRDGQYNTFVGARSSTGFLSQGSYNVTLGANTNSQDSSPLFDTVVIGYDARVDPVGTPEFIRNAIAIGAGAVVEESNAMQLGNASLSKILTEAQLTTGDITYPRVAGATGHVLKLGSNGTGELQFQPDNDSLIDMLESGACKLGQGLIVSSQGWQCYTAWMDVTREVSALEQKLEENSDKLLEVIDLQAKQIAAQQDQIAELQRLVEHQFAAR